MATRKSNLDGAAGHGEAKVIAMRLSKTPKGEANWTLDLLQERVIVLSVVDSISRATLHNSLKESGMTQRKIHYWFIPPKENALFAANMKNVFDDYAQPYDRRHPHELIQGSGEASDAVSAQCRWFIVACNLL